MSEWNLGRIVNSVDIVDSAERRLRHNGRAVNQWVGQAMSTSSIKPKGSP